MAQQENPQGRARRGAHFKGEGASAAPRAPHATTGATSRYAMREAAGHAAGAAGHTMKTSRDAPRSVPLDDTSSFPTITGNEGAVISNRENASAAAHAARRDLQSRTRGSRQLSHAARKNVRTRRHKTQGSKRLFIGLGVAVILIVAVVGFVLTRAANSVSNVVATDAAQTDKKVTSADQTIQYAGFTFSVQQQEDGSYHFVRTAEGASEPLDLATLPGKPVSLALFNGAILISENLSDGSWNVVVYTAGDGSVVTALTNADGSEVSGQGELVSARIDGDNLVLKDASGQEKSVKLTN